MQEKEGIKLTYQYPIGMMGHRRVQTITIEDTLTPTTIDELAELFQQMAAAIGHHTDNIEGYFGRLE